MKGHSSELGSDGLMSTSSDQIRESDYAISVTNKQCTLAQPALKFAQATCALKQDPENYMESFFFFYLLGVIETDWDKK